MRWYAIALLLAAGPAACAADAVDAETARRAQELADTYERGGDQAALVAADPVASDQLAEAEVLLLEAEEAVQRGEPAAATKPFLAGTETLRAIDPTKRAGLEKRLRAADARLTRLARALLAAPGVLPRTDGPAEPAATDVPAAATKDD